MTAYTKTSLRNGGPCKEVMGHLPLAVHGRQLQHGWCLGDAALIIINMAGAQACRCQRYPRHMRPMHA